MGGENKVADEEEVADKTDEGAMVHVEEEIDADDS